MYSEIINKNESKLLTTIRFLFIKQQAIIDVTITEPPEAISIKPVNQLRAKDTLRIVKEKTESNKKNATQPKKYGRKKIVIIFFSSFLFLLKPESDTKNPSISVTRYEGI